MSPLQPLPLEWIPDGAQERNRHRFSGSCRVVFNEARTMRRVYHAAAGKNLDSFGLCQMRVQWRNGAPMPGGRVMPWLAGEPKSVGGQRQKPTAATAWGLGRV